MNSTAQKDFIEEIAVTPAETPEVLAYDDHGVAVENGVVTFSSFEAYRAQAIEIRDYLAGLAIDASTEATAKRLVADAHKISAALNQRKIDVKKEILSSYTVFEAQVKEIIGLISEGEGIARDKIRELDGVRRAEKREALEEIWEKRAGHCLAGRYLKIDSWLTDQHLNKTTPLAKSEEEMAAFLERASTDLSFLQEQEDAPELIVEYQSTLSVADAMAAVQRRKQKAAEAAKTTAQVTGRKPEPFLLVRIEGKADCQLAKAWLQENVNYKIIQQG